MTLFTYISHNIDRIKFDMRIGIVSCALMKHWQIYSRYDYYKRLGNSQYNAIIYCCNDFQVAQSWVYLIIKKMEAEI
jgi:hypothetical protein